MSISEIKPNVDKMEQNGDLEGLIRALKHNDCIIRKEAVVALKKIADKRALFQLIDALKYEKWQDKYAIMDSVRENAAEALGLIKDKRAVDPLINALKDKDEDVRWKAAWALGNIGDQKAIGSLIYALQDEYWPVRRFAASALGKIGHVKSVRSLINALDDDEWHVRKYAADSLGRIGDVRAIRPLVNTLNDPDGDVRWRAVVALGKMKNAAVEPLINALESNDWKIRGRVAEVLGNIGDKRAIEPLINALVGLNKDGNKYVRGRAAEALGKMGDERAIDPLIAAMDDPYIYVKIKAEEALEKLDSFKSIKSFDNGDISFEYPSAWEIVPLYDEKKIINGNSTNGTTFSVNKITDLEGLTSEEFASIIKDVFKIQNNVIISEDEFTIENIEVYIISGKNTSSGPITNIMIAAFKLEDLLYYLWFAGGKAVFKEDLDDIELIIDSFSIYIYK
ncbi:MAG: HEAT repeat domain-containing protein [Methanobacterium sp.]